MSIAGAWGREKGGIVGPMPGSTADQISARVIEASPYDDDVGDAMKTLAQGVRRRVTFRRSIIVRFSPSRNFKESMNKLPSCRIIAGSRGTTVSVVVDGRDVVELDDGRSVLALVGWDCKILGWWFKIVDRLRRRSFH